MARPRYETAADRTRESKAAALFASHYKDLKVTKMEHGAFADFEIRKGVKLVGYMEVKTRRCPSTQYRTYHVSKMKLLTLQKTARKHGVRPVLLVQWSDKAGWIDVDTYLANATFTTGGRWDRNDPHDVEEMAEVNIKDYFRFL